MTEITPLELERLRTTGTPHQLVDVREPYEAETCAMGGTLIPMGEVLDRLAELRRDVPVVFHCNTGNRSAAVAYSLEARYGFTGTMTLRGGIQAWAIEVDKDLKCD